MSHESEPIPTMPQDLASIVTQVLKNPYSLASSEEISAHKAGLQSIIDARRLAIQNEGTITIY